MFKKKNKVAPETKTGLKRNYGCDDLQALFNEQEYTPTRPATPNNSEYSEYIAIVNVKVSCCKIL